ncbi:2-oxoglutarate (2OG) and Fe(II)-dependent oxygenase superfamily protein [Striga asiatica]|uniref:2-oxoglutarate (2OG) and Fe(II)-dependent oxygenase superfamily protein n=1 Tax=Striga asiatica TaxID=4170 RepID=A0A5A7QQD4_STRAF|nr:2-oxoglutarate (2OG) and Fe(II)-dependent oxygenase superfamily protein [Striga asiatica]
MASSAEQPYHHRHPFGASAAPPPTPLGATAAPPPTPSAQTNLSTATAAPDLISHLLSRLPPTLSLSTAARRPSDAVAVGDAPSISLSDSTPGALLSAAAGRGFFRLADHRIPAHLPAAAEFAAAFLLSLPADKKRTLFPRTFPLGHETDCDDGASAVAGESFCLDPSRSAEWTTDELDLSPLGEFSREMERLGSEVLEEMARTVGFKKPAREQLRSLMWVSNGANNPGRVYPYVIGLQYQMRCQKLSLLSDSGWVTVSGQVDSVLVTLGDIAQVWSNGKLKKVRGRPIVSSSDEDNNPNCITMSLLITLPLEATVCPLIFNLVETKEGEKRESTEEKMSFNSFSFKDYAWRVYHEHVPAKDTLARYRV